jgi:hypothetical protein
MQICHECGTGVHHIHFLVVLLATGPQQFCNRAALLSRDRRLTLNLSVFSSNDCMVIEIRALVTVLFLYPLLRPMGST